MYRAKHEILKCEMDFQVVKVLLKFTKMEYFIGNINSQVVKVVIRDIRLW